MARPIFNMVLACTFAGALLSCSLNPMVGGGGTDFPNTLTITGRIYTADGKVASHASAKLVPSTFDPVADLARLRLVQDTTDQNGRP
jgi:hypothetical protein